MYIVNRILHLTIPSLMFEFNKFLSYVILYFYIFFFKCVCLLSACIVYIVYLNVIRIFMSLGLFAYTCRLVFFLNTYYILFYTRNTSVLTCSWYSVYRQKNVKSVPLFGILLKINLNTMKLVKNKQIVWKNNRNNILLFFVFYIIINIMFKILLLKLKK